MRVKLIFAFLFLAILAAGGCSKKVSTEHGKIGVVVTISPLAEFVEQIGGDKVEVSVMVPPGASPHSYEPTPAQLKKVSNAALYVKVGSPIEFELVWLDKILSLNKKMRVVDASKGIKLIGLEEEHLDKPEAGQKSNAGYDPHIWLSPRNAEIMVENIYEGLVSIDPDNKDSYTAGKDAYVHKLMTLDNDIRRILATKINRRFMVYHPAWGYFAKDYGLEEIPVEQMGKAPTIKGIAKLVEQARESHVKVIFASPQFNTQSAEVIAKEIGGRVVLIDALAKDYLANTRKVAQAFAEAME